jgi:ribokinase
MNSIVVMPDFFVDRLIKLNSEKQFFDSLADKARFGGGSIRGIPTVDVKGGNAVNVAYCLASLGAKVTLFTIADDIGSAIIRQIFLKFEDRSNLRIIDGKHGCTTSFEFRDEINSKVNVMVSDIGDNANFGPERIDSPADLKILNNADGVIVVNWASNFKGTQLAEHVFTNSPKALHFLDPADIDTRKQEFLDSITKISDIIDVLSINENEYNSLAGVVGIDTLPMEGHIQNSVRNAAKKLAEKIGVSIDLHTRIGAAWSNGKETEFVPAINVEAKTLTGAGDSWDAADIIGYLAGLDAEERLIYANVCSSLYVRNPHAQPATMTEVSELLERIGYNK